MRQLRWKRDYVTDKPEIDARNRDLYGILSEFPGELSKIEHCQEIEEVAERLNQAAAEYLAQAAAGEAHPDALRGLVDSAFPLETLGTSACRQCGMCEKLEKKMVGWLADTVAAMAGSSPQLDAQTSHVRQDPVEAKLRKTGT